MSLSVVALASCSTLGLGDESKSDSNMKVPSKSEKKLADNDAGAPISTIVLKQVDKDNIKATIKTTYNNNPKGSVKLQWQSPVGSKCYNTTFPITKYKESNDKTWASVKIKQGKILCKGEWTANVIFDNRVIGTDSILIN